MTEGPAPRSVHVVAADDGLVRALAEHRPARLGWRIALAGPLAPDALVIVDLDGTEAQRRAIEILRGEGFAGPVLILGGADAARWADDEPLPRPVRLGALLARLDAHWAEAATGNAIRLGLYVFVPAERLLRRTDGAAAIRLTEIENRLLAHLAEAGGALIERDRLLARVWGYSAAVDSHTIETHVWRLRQKIETDEPDTHILVTEAGGYRLLAGAGQHG